MLTLLMVLLAGLVGAAPAQAATFTVSGVVVDQREKPLAGMDVEALTGAVTHAATTSGADGTFQLTVPASARYQIYASDPASAHLAGISWAEVGDQSVDVGQIQLNDIGATLPVTGTVVGPDGAPLAGILVSLSGAGLEERDRTAEDGSFRVVVEQYRLLGLSLGDPTGRFTFPGKSLSTGTEALDVGTLTMTTVSEPGSFVGTVTDVAAQPLQGIVLSAGRQTTVTGADGRYRLTLPAGTYQLTASDPAGRYVSQTVAELPVTTAGETTQDFTLTVKRPEGAVVGALFRGDGQPLDPSQYRLRLTDGTQPLPAVEPNADGTFRLVASPGTYTLEVHTTAGQKVAERESISIRDGDVNSLGWVNVAPAPVAVITGRVLGTDGQPLDANPYHVQLRQGDVAFPPATQLPGGRFQITTEPGTYSVEVWDSENRLRRALSGPFTVEAGQTLDVGDLTVKALPTMTLTSRTHGRYTTVTATLTRPDGVKPTGQVYLWGGGVQQRATLKDGTATFRFVKPKRTTTYQVGYLGDATTVTTSKSVTVRGPGKR